MATTYTANAHLALQATGEDSGTWGSNLNADVFTIIDGVFGNVQTISLSSTNVTLTTSQTQVATIKLTGVLTANVTVFFPAIGRTFIVQNSTTGAFSVTLAITGTPGATALSPQGSIQNFTMDSANVYAVSGAPLAPNSVTNNNLAVMAAGTVKGNSGSSSSSPGDLTGAAVRALSGIAPKGYLFGLTLSNDAGTPDTIIDIAAGEAASSNTGPTLISIGNFTKKLNTPWTSGTGNGGLATGSSFPSDGTLHVYVIGGPSVGGDVLADNSATSPTLPSGYTLYRRIGSLVVRSSAIRTFLQTGDDFYWTDPIVNFSGTYSTPTLVTLTIPPGIRVLAYLNVSSQSTTNNSSIGIGDGTNSNIVVNVSQGTGGSSGGSGGGPVQQYSNTGAQVYVQTSGSGPTGSVTTLGWRDTRGRY